MDKKKKEKKEYKTGQIQDNGLMYDPVYDLNKDGKVDWIEEMERQKDIERSQQRREERQNEKREQKLYSPPPQATGASGTGCLGAFLAAFFSLGGIGLCFTTESGGLKILCIFGGLALALASAYFCGLFGTTQKDDKELGTVESAAVKAKQHMEYDIQNDKAKLIKIISVVAVILIAVVLLCNIGNMKNAHYYTQAVSLVNAGEYESAQQSLSEIEEYKYKEKSELYDFCTALKNFDNGKRVSGPNFSYDAYAFDFKFSDEIEKKRVAINKQLEKQKTELEQKLKEREREKHPEWYTTTRVATEKNTEETTVRESTTRYSTGVKGSGSFYGGAKGYSGSLSAGRSSGSQSGSSQTTKQATTKKKDPYDVNSYSNEEDFYDDHYDDFMDYYEAEDYYNEHHD